MQQIKDWNFEPLFESLHQKYNLDLSNYAIASLGRRLERFLGMNHFESVQSLTNKLLNDTTFFESFVREITVNTTEMFRDPVCWQVLRTEIFPLLNELPTIRVWHAGCSSGEEVYSMAIMLQEEGLFEKTKLVATDINRAVMDTAAKGAYNLKTMPLNEENYSKSGGKKKLADYYTENNGIALMDQNLLQNVKFLKHDLSTGVPFSKFDIILCRNVMIYFNKELQEKVFSTFHHSLFKRGFVVIGKKESMSYYTELKKFSEYNQPEKIYRLI